MSYVLDALNQVEKRRKEERPASVEEFLTSEPRSHNTPRRTQVLIPVAATALTMVIGFSAWKFVSDEEIPVSRDVAPGSTIAPLATMTNTQSAHVMQTVVTTERKTPPPINIQSASPQVNQESEVARPDIKATGYLFLGTNSPSNKVFVNGRGYRKGSLISGYQVIRIESSSFTVKKNGQEFQLSY